MSGLLRKLLGNQGEKVAAKFLKKKGMKILARQYAGEHGEIDLIANDHETVVFVEVKTRRTLDAGHPAEAVTEEKQRHLTSTAQKFLHEYQLNNVNARFDVIALVWSEESSKPEIEYFPNAFEASDL